VSVCLSIIILIQIVTQGKVGGYGVGFKVGAIAMAQTAIVLSISLKDENTGTTVVGVLSNEPFEERGEFPLGLRRPNTEIIALWTKNGRVYEKKGVKEADRDELCKKIKQLNSSIDRDWITTWAGARQGKSGTTIILCGVRHMFRGNDLGQSFKAHTPPRIRIDFINPHDMVLMEFDDLRKVSVPFRHHPTARRIIGHAAKMDSSLRAFCEIMFLMEGPSKHISINLFGKPVKRVCYNKVLRNKMPDKLKDGKNIINCMLGQHTFRDDEDLYGAMLYCEGTLITAYARPHNLEFRRSRNNNNDDEEHFSSVLVVDLKKQHGFEPTPEKLEFNFNDAKKERFWDAVKGKIEEYADKQASLRDEKFPLRPLFFNCIKDLKVRLRDYEGDYSEEGPLRGVLFIPGRESDSSDHETYHGFIKDPISLKDIERKIKQEGSARPIYVGDAEDKTLAFKKDITKVLKNSIKWESEGRFIADTVEDLDINDVTAGDIDAATTQPFVCPSSGTKGPFTIKDMLKKLDIPDEFKKATFEANRSAYPEMKDWTTELNHSTTLLVPHRRSVAAVKFAKRLLTIVDEQVEGFPAIIRSKKRAKEKGTVDDLVQCSLCQNWRKFPGAVIKYGEVNFTCEMEGRSCEEPDDYNRHTDIHLSSHRDNDHSVGSPVVTENSSDDNLDVSQGKKRRRVYTSDSSEDMKSRVKIKNSTIEGEIGKKVRTRPISPVSRAAASFAHPLNDVPRKRRRNKKPPTIEIGSKIKKWFEDELNSGWRFGTVVSLKSLANPHYIISYTNGDREQYSDKEILLRYIQNDEVVPDHTPSENFTLLRSSDVLATEFVEQMEKCLAAVKNIQHVQMSKHVSEMLKIWNEAESRNQEILVYNKITLSSWTLYRALLKKAKPSKCNARFMGLLDEVRTSVREVKNKIKRMEEESTAPINVDRAPRVPHELAPSTLHKDPERVAATARGLGIENAPETHEEWLHFAKTRTEEADKLSKVLKERKEQDELEI